MSADFFLAWKYFKPKRSAVSVITLISVIGVALGVGVLIVVLAVMTGFTDTAADLCGGNIPGTIYSRIKEICRDLFWHEVKIIDGVTDTLEALSGRFSLVVATKGDMMEQERKFRESGLEKYFSGFEVMQDKDERNYSALARKYGLSPSGIVMAGNSVRSDIVPVVSVGGTAIHVPHELVWEHEAMDMPQSDRVIEVQSIRDLVTLLCS